MAIERSILEIEKQAGGLDEITKLTGTIKSNSEKILKRAEIMRAPLAVLPAGMIYVISLGKKSMKWRTNESPDSERSVSC